LPGRTEENQKKSVRMYVCTRVGQRLFLAPRPLKSVRIVFRSRFKPSTSRIQIRRVSATPTDMFFCSYLCDQFSACKYSLPQSSLPYSPSHSSKHVCPGFCFWKHGPLLVVFSSGVYGIQMVPQNGHSILLSNYSYFTPLRPCLTRDSLVGKATDYGLDDWSSIPDRDKRFSLLHSIQSDQSNGYWVKRPGREVDYSPPSSTEVKNGRAIPLFHHTSSWRGA
jgi:hypothetical protein